MLNLNKKLALHTVAIFVFCCISYAQGRPPAFRVIAFYTSRNDQAHISFVHEANKWFPAIAAKYKFTYDSTNNWDNLNAEFLSHYQVVLFLDTRPETPAPCQGEHIGATTHRLVC